MSKHGVLWRVLEEVMNIAVKMGGWVEISLSSKPAELGLLVAKFRMDGVAKCLFICTPYSPIKGLQFVIADESAVHEVLREGIPGQKITHHYNVREMTFGGLEDTYHILQPYSKSVRAGLAIFLGVYLMKSDAIRASARELKKLCQEGK